MTTQITLPREVVEQAIVAHEDYQQLLCYALKDLPGRSLTIKGEPISEFPTAELRAALTEQVQEPSICSSLDIAAELGRADRAEQVQPAQGEREEIIRMAKEAGMRASVGKTDKEGNYHPDKNALGNHVPVEWLERFAALLQSNAERVPLESMTDLQRMEVFNNYCTSCGCKDPRCQCWNDE